MKKPTLVAAFAAWMSLLLSAVALADSGGLPMPGLPPVDGTVLATPSGESASTNTDSQAARQPSVAVSKKCSTNRRKHVKICRYYRSGVLFKICTQKRGAKQKCRKIAMGPPKLQALAPAKLVPSSSVSASLVSGRINSGYPNPILPAIVRLYRIGSPVPDNGWCSGSLLLRGIVLTAAHCLWDSGEESRAAPHGYDYANGNMQVVPGNRVVQGQNTGPFGTWNHRGCLCPDGIHVEPS
jgi:hypothetical protein